MKSFVEFIQESEQQDKPKKEGSNEMKRSELKGSEHSSKKKKSFNPSDVKFKEIYSESDYNKDSSKPMKISASFGSHELMFTNPEPRRPEMWEVKFTKGFESLDEKDEDEIKDCLKALSISLDGFMGADIDWSDIEPDDFWIKIKTKYREVVDIIKKYLKDHKLSIEHDGFKRGMERDASQLFVLNLSLD